jgi:kinetochore protein NDC80
LRKRRPAPPNYSGEASIISVLLDTRLTPESEEELAGLRAKLASLHEVVKEQNLSADEVIRMNTEHEALSRNARELGGKAQDGRNAVSALEVAVANRASKADEAVETYNDKLLALQLAATGPGGAALTLELNTASSVPEEILVGPDVRKDIKPALNRAAEQRRLQKAQIESEKLKVDHIVHILTTDCDNEQEAVDLVVRETTQLTDQEAAIKEVGLDSGH